MLLLLSGICFVLAALVFSLVKQALPLYFLWLVLVGLYIWFQARFVLMPIEKRPERYDAIANTLFVTDLAIHIAVAAFCRVGWFGIPLLVLTYFCSGRLARQLATRRALQDIFRILAEHEPDMAFDRRVRVAQTMLEQRAREFLQGK